MERRTCKYGISSSMANRKPTQGIIDLCDFLKKTFGCVELRGKVLDLGCGKGRNSIYLATQGYDVIGVDYIEDALSASSELANEFGVGDRFLTVEGRIDEALPFDDDSFDVVVDSYSSIDIETKKGRLMCRDEMMRVLKNHGYGLILVVSADDEMEKQFIKNDPGPEPNSCYWPMNRKFQKDYDSKELIEFYTENKSVSIVEIRTIEKPAFKLGQNFVAKTFWMLIQKVPHD